MLGVAFSSQITLGNVLTLLFFLLLAVGSYFRLKGMRNEELGANADFWREQVEPLTNVVDELHDQIRRLTAERDEQRRLKHEITNDLAAEKLKTDLSAVVKAFTASHEALLSRIELAEHNNVAVVSRLEESMVAHFGALSETQEMLTETMRGLLQSVSALNKRP